MAGSLTVLLPLLPLLLLMLPESIDILCLISVLSLYWFSGFLLAFAVLRFAVSELG